MLLLKTTNEYRADSEQEVLAFNTQLKEHCAKDGTILSSFSYTKKQKKAKGEIVDEGYLVKAVVTHGGFWDGLE